MVGAGGGRQRPRESSGVCNCLPTNWSLIRSIFKRRGRLQPETKRALLGQSFTARNLDSAILLQKSFISIILPRQSMADNGAMGATMLSFEADKEDYLVGETAILMFHPQLVESPFPREWHQGASEVLGKDTGRSIVIMFRQFKEMAPNVYAHVTLVQPHEQTKNDQADKALWSSTEASGHRSYQVGTGDRNG